MDEIRGRESGASEVIGAVLLVGLVVIGGAIAAAFVFGQPAPKEMPHVSFGVSLDGTTMTLHHTGGDALGWGQYSVYVQYVNGTIDDKTPDVVDQVNPWTSDGDMKITGVTEPVGNVILSFRDGGGGETVLRRVAFEEVAPVTVSPPGPWTISGYKWNVTSSGQQIGPLENVTIRLMKTAGNIDFPTDGMVTTTNETGFYRFSVPEFEATYSLAEEINLTLWKPISPSSGRYDGIRLTRMQPSAVKDFSNYRLPPPPKKISGHKYNVTWKGTNPTPLAGFVINLTLMSGDVPTFPTEGKTTTTNDTGYYEFEVPGWWEFEVPAVLPTYRLAEEYDPTAWYPHNPVSRLRDQSSAVIENVLPDTSDHDFWNEMLVPNKKIWGYKWGYYTTGELIGPVSGITITLTLTGDDTPDMTVGQTRTNRTDDNGYYEFEVSGHPSLYSLKETMSPLWWTAWMPSNGTFVNVPPGSTRDFKNMHVVPPPSGGSVIRLEKEQPADPNLQGYLVGGSYLQFDTKGGNYVTFGTRTFTFGNNEEVRFVMNGDQREGRLTITKGSTTVTELAFNVTLQKQVNGVWTDVSGASGMVTDISITNINKNGYGGNLTYRQPSYASDTMLRLDGEPVITSPPEPPNSTPLKFVDMYITHDNSEHEGNNIMFVWLTPEMDSLLVEGGYVYL
ncbi:MAG: type IV pilin N-terminal domain-containing protein [Methanospirillum sp.]